MSSGVKEIIESINKEVAEVNQRVVKTLSVRYAEVGRLSAQGKSTASTLRKIDLLEKDLQDGNQALRVIGEFGDGANSTMLGFLRKFVVPEAK